jgi:hypothetical protein
MLPPEQTVNLTVRAISTGDGPMPHNKHPEQDPVEGSRKTVQRALNQSEKSTNHGEGGTSSPEADARGQFAKSKAGANNDGVSSADPRVLSGKENGDATFPLKQDKWE